MFKTKHSSNHVNVRKSGKIKQILTFGFHSIINIFLILLENNFKRKSAYILENQQAKFDQTFTNSTKSWIYSF